MKLFFSPTSPYVRKVRAVAIGAGLADRIELMVTDVYDPNSPLHRANPTGRVPALVTDDGTVLFDSPVICEYLDSLNGGKKLLPPAGPARWAALKRQALGDGLMDAAVPWRQEVMRPEGQQSPEIRDRRRRNVMGTLDYLESTVDEIRAAGVDVGTLAIGCALGYLDLRFADERWRDKHPKLAAWYEEFAKRPSMADTAPPPA